MTANQLLEALSASFFCLLGLWAAAARGHWFVRVAVAGGCLLGALLIPAYLVTIEFGLQIAVIMLGVAWVRKPASWRPRFSMETALLAMVVVAVSTAVLKEGLAWSLSEWIWVLGVGVGTGLLGLVCLWLVCGRARWYWRVLGFAAFLGLFAAGGVIVEALRQCLSQRQPGQTLAAAIGDHFTAEAALQALGDWLTWFGPSVALGIVILLSVICLAAHSGWFEEPSPTTGRSHRRRRWFARGGICAIVAAVLTPLLYVFYRLMTPEPMWAYDPPTPNGYDDFVAAGELVPELFGRSLANYNLWNASPGEVREYVLKLGPVYNQIAEGMKKPCLAPINAKRGAADEIATAAADEASAAMTMRWQSLWDFGDDEAFFAAAMEGARFDFAVKRGQGLDDHPPGIPIATWSFRHRLWKLTAKDCRKYLPQLLELERMLEPYDVLVRRERIRNQNADWETHLRMILNEWNVAWGYPDENWWSRLWWHTSVAEFRLLTTQLALRAYRLERGALPAAIDDLVPEYLPATPIDPFDDQPLRYRRQGDRYTLYSVGANLIDDGGSRERDDTSGQELDVVVSGPVMPPNWKRFVDAVRPAIDEQLRRAPTLLRAWAEELRRREAQ